MSATVASAERFARQQDVFPQRLSTALIELGGREAPLTSRYVKIGAAIAGIPLLMSDYHGNGRPSGHWSVGPHPAMVKRLSECTNYGYLDPGYISEDIRPVIGDYANLFLVVHLNRPAAAQRALRSLVHDTVSVPVLLTCAGAGGFAVVRMPDPEAAAEYVESIRPRSTVRESRCAELPMGMAGLILNELILRSEEDQEHSGGGLVAAYSVAHPLRIDFAHAPLAELIDAITLPMDRASFRGRTITLVGAGALGNWTLMAVAMDRGASATIYDGDFFEETNLARQPLGVRHVGESKSITIAAQARELDPEGDYHGYNEFVYEPTDLKEPLSEILFAMPDNDQTRHVVAGTGWQAGRLVATAATGPRDAKIMIQEPDRACLQCLTGQTRSGAASLGDGAQSCAAEPQPSIVSSNMIAAALAVSETREVLVGRKSRSLRFIADAPLGNNKLAKHVTDPACRHRS